MSLKIEDFAQELGVSVHYIEHHFPRIKESWRKRGIILIKNGKGKSANYGILKEGEVNVRF